MNLEKKKVVITRAIEQADEIVKLFKEKEAEVILFPTIKIRPIFSEQILKAVESLGGYEWVIFTSANGVRYFVAQIKKAGISTSVFSQVKICAIGPATASALKSFSLKPHIVPSKFIAEEVLKILKNEDIKGKRILIPRAKEARDVLPKGLQEEGALVDVVAVYETIQAEPDKKSLSQLEEAHIFTFTSPSTVKGFFGILGEKKAKEVLLSSIVASIGPITTSALRSFGIENIIEAKEYTVYGIVKALEEA